MIKKKFWIYCIFLVVFVFTENCSPQGSEPEIPDFLNYHLDREKRIQDLLSRLTLEEKISQMIYNAPEIPKLGIPEYNWWNEALHGVARSGLSTVFPQAIALAASCDTNLLYQVASIISDEARAKYHYYI